MHTFCVRSRQRNDVINGHIEKERNRAIKERERAKKIREYHRKILDQGQIADVSEAEIFELFEDDRSFSSLVSELRALRLSKTRDVSTALRRTPSALPPLNATAGGMVGSGRFGAAQESLPPPVKHRPLMSMATQLGAKSKAFGTADVKKKKKRKRGKKRKSGK